MFKWLFPLEPMKVKQKTNKTERGKKDDAKYKCRNADKLNHDGPPHSEEGS
jgi:hypothetical protein